MSLPPSDETVSRFDHAFLRLATPEDLHDAIFLALSGVHVAFEPVPGFLTGFGKPRRIVDTPAAITVSVDRTPATIAAAILRLVTHKGLGDGTAICLDIADSDLKAAITGIVRCLNQRAARPFSRTDIADIMGWIATLTPARIDAQVPYGSDEWGAFLRGDPSLGLGWYPPPAASNFSRTIVCHVKPSDEDLARILSSGSVGLINAVAMRRRAPWAAGTGPDKRLLLPSHALAPMLAWTPADAGAALPVMTRSDLLTAGSPRPALQALYGAAWDRAQELARQGYLATCEAVPEPLQAIWSHQREGQHPFGIDVVAMPPCDPEDLRRHALYGGIRAADDLRLPRPHAVTTTRVTTTDPVGTLVTQAHWLDKLAGHNVAAQVVLRDGETAEVVSHLSGRWSEFVGAEFSAEQATPYRRRAPGQPGGGREGVAPPRPSVEGPDQ